MLFPVRNICTYLITFEHTPPEQLTLAKVDVVGAADDGSDIWYTSIVLPTAARNSVASNTGEEVKLTFVAMYCLHVCRPVLTFCLILLVTWHLPVPSA